MIMVRERGDEIEDEILANNGRKKLKECRRQRRKSEL